MLDASTEEEGEGEGEDFAGDMNVLDSFLQATLAKSSPRPSASKPKEGGRAPAKLDPHNG